MKKILNVGVVFVLLFNCFTALGVNAEKQAKVTLNKTKVNISVGDVAKLKVTNTNKKIKWKSSKKKVARVNKNGVVRGKKPGKAVITAKVGKKTLKCKVVVKDKPRLVIDDVQLCVGARELLFVKGTGKKIEWSTSDENVVKVEKDTEKSAYITAVKKGNATVIAKVGKTKLACAVSVQNTIEIEKSNLQVGNSASRPIFHLSDNIVVSSSDESIAKVTVEYDSTNGLYGINSNLYVFGLKNGTVDISIMNKLNDEVVTFKAIVTKPKENTAKQKVVDFVLGNFNDGGCGYYSSSLYTVPKGVVSYRKTYNYGMLTPRVYYDSNVDDIGFCYESVESSSVLVWHMTPVAGYNGKYNITFMEIPLAVPCGAPVSIEGRNYKAVYNCKNNSTDNLVFTDLDGKEVNEIGQKDANEFHREALLKINSILESMVGVNISDL